MVLLLLSLVVPLGTQLQLDPLPQAQYRAAIIAGQREVVLGPQLQYETTMQIDYDKYVDAVVGDHYVSPAGSANYSEGFIRWSVKDDTLFNSPCRLLKMDCLTKGVNHYVTKKIEYSSSNSTSWWITPEGKLLRQSVRLIDPTGQKSAECVYWSDHIEVSIVDAKGRRAFTVFPNVDLHLVDAQFKPMVVDNKVVLGEKEYYVFDPFTQAFNKYKAVAAGTFSGVYMATKFDGQHVDIEGPKLEKQVVYVSKEGDLVKVDLSETETINMTNVPRSKDPLYKKLAGGS